MRAVFEAWTREELAKFDGQIPIDFLTQIKDDLPRYLEIWLEIRPHEFAQWLLVIDWGERLCTLSAEKGLLFVQDEFLHKKSL